jgi:cyclohexanone monooxygenase
MPLLEEVNYMPTEKYARAKELLHHSRMIGEKFGLYSHALFQTEVKEMRWDETTGLWTTSTSLGDKIRSRFVIPAAGPLHRPKLLGVDGIEDFKGHAFHSSRWDFNYTGGDPAGGLEKLKDKRVAIIGTGATAVQIVPHLGEWAKQLYVFQRTPSSIDVRGNKPTDPSWASTLKPGWQRKRMLNFDSVVNGGIEAEDMVADGWTDIIRELLTKWRDVSDIDPVEAGAQRQIADFQKMEQIRARCDNIVKDKATADGLKPWYNQFCKRPCFHDEYLQTFNRPNVKLVDTRGNGVERITEKGVVANGEEYEVDCLIYATGFELATDWTHRTGFEIYGRDGLTITEKWKEGASTLHGWTTRGFPNCLIVQVVQAALTPNFMHVTAEQARHFAYVISESKKRGIRTFEPTEEAEKSWTQTIVEGTALRADFFKECTPGYYNNEGKPSVIAARNATYGAGSPAFLKILFDWQEKNELSGLDLKPFEKEEPALAEGKEYAGGKNVDEETHKTGEQRNLVRKYADLQAKHQAEVNDLMRRQRDEIERLLKSHEKTISVSNGVNGVNGVNGTH